MLIVLFLVSYGLLTMLVVEQGRTIDSQRSLIRMLFSDSVELNGMKGKENQRQQAEAEARAQARRNRPRRRQRRELPRCSPRRLTRRRRARRVRAPANLRDRFRRSLRKPRADQDDERRILVSI